MRSKWLPLYSGRRQAALATVAPAFPRSAGVLLTSARQSAGSCFPSADGPPWAADSGGRGGRSRPPHGPALRGTALPLALAPVPLVPSAPRRDPPCPLAPAAQPVTLGRPGAQLCLRPLAGDCQQAWDGRSAATKLLTGPVGAGPRPRRSRSYCPQRAALAVTRAHGHAPPRRAAAAAAAILAARGHPLGRG